MGRRRAGWAALNGEQMWPGMTTPTIMTRTGGGCFLFGGLVVVVLTALAPLSFSSTAVQYGNAAVACAVGALVLLWGRRLRLWQFHAMVVVATLQTTVSVFEATNPAVAVSFATLYVFTACAAFFLPWPAAIVQLVVAIACCMVALGVTSTVPWWSGLVASGTTAAIGIVIAILGRVALNAELDDVTGLLNRRGFERSVGIATGRVAPGGARCSIILVCVDGYTAFCDEFGAQAGDEVMQQIVASWRAVLEPDQVLARRGADEFGVLLPAATSREAVSFTHAMRSAISRSCSAGVTTWQPGEHSSATIARADVAVRRAKRSGLNRTMVESANLPPLAVELRDALEAEAINVCYQPVVSMDSGDVVGFEALVRWVPPSRPDISASEVVRVAEESHLIAMLGHYVLRRACRDAGRIQQRAPDRTLTLSVNASGLELVQVDYAQRVFNVLRETGWAATQLVLEVTESVLDVDRPSAIAALHGLRAGGVRIAIDDFGTGYSSLSRLQALPTDFLKLDATFIAAVTPTSPEVPPLLQAVAALAQALSLPVVAEGVETVQQVDALRRLGFALAQGFFFGRPQTSQEIAETVRSKTKTFR
jgi:diguanylate cyclase (GGDEF)-like protein